MNTDEITKSLRRLAKETEFVFAAEQLDEAADLIESLKTEITELRKNCDISDAANTALHGALQNAERRADAAVECLNATEPCDFCKHYDENCICGRPYEYGYCFEWRGVEE